MSVENYGLNYPRERLFGLSWVATFANGFAEEGGERLRSITNKSNESNTLFALNRESLLKIPEEDRHDMLKNYAAIIFGVSIVCLEKSLVEKRFNYNYWCALYNLNITGTQFAQAPAKEGAEKEEIFCDKRWGKMIEVAKNDKTLALFFSRDNISLMPKALSQYIDDMGIIGVIRDEIIPLYQERAKVLVVE
ncbi:MAG: hypothetical protein AAB600_04675 [Patescibacteria group bacterium]